MGKGRLTTSSSTFAMQTYSYGSSAIKSLTPDSASLDQKSQGLVTEREADFPSIRLPKNKRYAGHIIVNCKDSADPTMGSWIVAVESPLPPGVRDKDLVEFRYTSWLTARVKRKGGADPCERPFIEVTFDEPVKRVKPRPKKLVKKKVVRKTKRK